MLVLVLVVEDALFLDAFLDDGGVDADDALGVGRGGEGGDLEAVEGAAGVAFRRGDKMLTRVGGELDFQLAETAPGIGEGGVDEGGKLGGTEGLELKNLRARDERAVDVERRIMRCCADQPD
jgi:hypothetical protein